MNKRKMRERNQMHLKNDKFKSVTCSRRRIFTILLFVCTVVTMAWLLITSSVVEGQRDHQLIEISESSDRRIMTSELKRLLNCQDKRLTTKLSQHGDFWLLQNLIRGERSIDMGCADSITLTTIGDYTYMGHVETLVSRWVGPISLALFAPGYDFETTLDAIQYARNCLPQSELIRDYVTFHLYFPNEHMPPHQVPLTEEEALEWPYDCLLPKAPYENVKRSEMYKTKKNVFYPINVGRNIARKSANTYFIFASDIELYPSWDVIDQFLVMAVNNVTSVKGGNRPRVFPLPVFEVPSDATVPETKEELVEMLEEKIAIPFHSYICKECHLVPNQDSWVQANVTDDLEVFTVGKRHDKFVHWEPFYISDNTEPDFDERVTWEGQGDKRVQNLAMCLLDYEYHVLHPAFLVHAPGIKFAPKPERLRYVGAMNKVIANKIEREYRILYGRNKKCKF